MFDFYQLTSRKKLLFSLKKMSIDFPFLELEVNQDEKITINLNEINKIYIKINKSTKLYYLVVIDLIIWFAILWQYSFLLVEIFLFVVLLLVVIFFIFFNKKIYILNVLLKNGIKNRFFFSINEKYETIEQLQKVKRILNGNFFLER